MITLSCALCLGLVVGLGIGVVLTLLIIYFDEWRTKR